MRDVLPAVLEQKPLQAVHPPDHVSLGSEDFNSFLGDHDLPFLSKLLWPELPFALRLCLIPLHWELDGPEKRAKYIFSRRE